MRFDTHLSMQQTHNKTCKKISPEIFEDRTVSQQKIDLLLPIASLIFDAILILEMTIKNCYINHRLLKFSFFLRISEPGMVIL